MLADELTRALIEETTLEDISESYRPVVEIIGIRKFIELSEYAKGDELYFPKTENIIAPARNRRIKKEWNGYNSKELAEKYNLTIKQIGNILKDEPMIGQLSIFDMADVSQIIVFIGVMAFIVSVITEALKKWTWFDKKVPTALTVILLSLILCPVCLLGLAAYYGVAIEWFMVFASFIAAFIVALVSMDGWERVTELAEKLIRKQ